jgi:hypothetical protein
MFVNEVRAWLKQLDVNSVFSFKSRKKFTFFVLTIPYVDFNYWNLGFFFEDSMHKKIILKIFFC